MWGRRYRRDRTCLTRIAGLNSLLLGRLGEGQKHSPSNPRQANIVTPPSQTKEPPMRTLAALAVAALLCACASTAGNTAQPTPIAPRQAWIVAADGRPVGQATFTEAPGGVMIRLEFSDRGLAPGWHGLHLH